MLPEELYDVVWQGLDSEVGQIQYSQVIMPLSALLDGDFFNLYIKTGIDYPTFPVASNSRSFVSFVF